MFLLPKHYSSSMLFMQSWVFGIMCAKGLRLLVFGNGYPTRKKPYIMSTTNPVIQHATMLQHREAILICLPNYKAQFLSNPLNPVPT